MSASPTVEKSVANASHVNETRESPEMKEPDPGAEHEEHGHGVDWTELVRIAFVGLAAAAVWFRLWEPFAHFSVIGIAATLIGGYPIFKEAFENIVERKMTMELSMTIALLSALAIGEFFTAVVITDFVLAAEVLEGLTVGRVRRAIQSLLDFLPKPVLVPRNDQLVEVASGQVQVGDTVIVKPGEHIPVGPTPLTKDPRGNTGVAISAITKINRTDFGLTWNATLETGGILVGDEVTITLDVEFVKA
jgi:cation transport ATPase